MIRIYNVEEVMQALQLSRATVQRLMASGQLPYSKIHGSLRFTDEDIAQCLANGRVR